LANHYPGLQVMLVQVVYAFRLVITHFIALIIISASSLTTFNMRE